MIIKKSIITLTLAFFVAGMVNLKAQWAKTPWIVGVGMNVVDDSGQRFRGLFDIQNNWNMVPYPSRLSIEKVLGYGISLELAGTYNQLRAGKRINGKPNPTTTNYYAIDLSAKYNLNEAFGPTGWFNPYVMAGYGFSDRGIPTRILNNEDPNEVSTGAVTHNVGLGFNTWLSNDFAVQFQTMAKFVNKTSSNHLQHSVGFVYKFGGARDSFYRGSDGKSRYIKNYKAKSASDHLRKIINK